MNDSRGNNISLRQHREHRRDFRANDYVYPVISRRSGGLSIGINLNPDKACNFDCIYCQVDRSQQPRVRRVDLKRLEDELAVMIDMVFDGSLFNDAGFSDVPASMRAVRDFALSGDGEPTTCSVFVEAVQLVADAKRRNGLTGAPIVLITDACYLTRPTVVEGLRIMDANQGEVWAKLDAGTEEYYQLINRPNYPLQHVVDNIIATARDRSVVIQSLFMKVDGFSPSDDEVDAFIGRLDEIVLGGGTIGYVQVYTVARKPAESSVTALSNEEVDRIASRITVATALRTEAFYGG